ncbi:WxL protein peptidoglycan domain-containing protein [Actinoplanes sp. HUAS TT8]|uniref:WxL protein peptidoglycan domain-containing protein n=1 Tax=Actinoplanes sp. HUAS TT8 TaxID=3447453 RepID=UPI003F522F1F
MRIRASVLALSILAVLIPATPAAAAGNGEWSVTPTPAKNPGPTPRLMFFLDAPGGQTVKESVRVSNLTTKPKSFLVYGADAYNTPHNGGFAFRSRDEKQADLGSWVVSPVSSVEIPARTSADIPFTIAVPSNATPGDHVGGIVAMEAEPGATADADGAAVRVQRAVAARIYLRVAGTIRPGLSVADLTVDIDAPLLPIGTDGAMAYRVSNIGNVHLVPGATVKVTGLFGHRITAEGSEPSSDMVPGADGTFTARTRGIWPLDVVTTRVTVRAEGDVYAARSKRTVVVSWSALALLALLVLAIWWRIRRRVRSRVAKPRGLVATG